MVKTKKQTKQKNNTKDVSSKQEKKEEIKEKEYVVIYESEEHFEVLGYVKANSLEEAKEKAQKELLSEAQYYNVTDAEIDEIGQSDYVSFNITTEQ
jgi:hypothetical protein